MSEARRCVTLEHIPRLVLQKDRGHSRGRKNHSRVSKIESHSQNGRLKVKYFLNPDFILN